MYQNTERTRSHSEFVQVDPFDGTILAIDANTPMLTVVGKPVPMVKGSVRVTTPAAITSCDPQKCDGSVNESVSIAFNIKQGSVDSLAALRAEAIRCFDACVSQYNLALGVVPPSDATFPGA